MSLRSTGAGPGVRLEVDWSRCRGHGHCAVLLPELIRPDEWGYPIVGDQQRPGPASRGAALVPRAAEDAAERAVAWCPNLALRLQRTSGPVGGAG